ncbi:lipase maturation factor 1 [Hoplias malabaricus]|uniref:lipase maturation factor 1 n=1 Tax=Hoplias malabaricus TaxID=27720 RepID=UPI003462530A
MRKDMAADSEEREGVLRKRRANKQQHHQEQETKPDPQPRNGAEPQHGPGEEEPGLHSGTFWLSRVTLLRALSFVYFVAFAVAYTQNRQLIGERGLMPCRDYLRSVKRYVGGKVGVPALLYAPTLLWLMDWTQMDANLDLLAAAGLVLSGFIILFGRANVLIMTSLWILYHSISSVGQLWYSFGWESQLLETGFLGIFLCPFWSLQMFDRRSPPSKINIWTFRWLIFRIMLGAGLIKIRGDRCWMDLTCMDYHYETQPVPNPVSYYLHHSPWWFHRFETLSNHFVELMAPFFMFLGRRMCLFNGALQILFQVVLIISGNLSFLNWLTIVPSLACFDDAALASLFSRSVRGTVLKIQREDAARQNPPATTGMILRRAVNIALGLLITYLSVPVVINLLSPRQVMNTSYDPLRIVNTYGAFGSVNKERLEVVLQGSVSEDPGPDEVQWREYEFLCKPGAVDRKPCLISPYHLRLDWLMWFAAFQTYEQNEWVIQIAGRLLVNDSTVLSLMAQSPFQGGEKPRWIRGELYRYKFTKPGSTSALKGNWWNRRRIGPYFPPVNIEGLRRYFQSRNWPQPDS